LQRPPAIAFDISTLDDAQRAGATQLRICDTETGKTYCASIRLVREHGLRFNRDFGDQIALPLAYWSIDGALSEVKRNEAIQVAKREQAGQLSLFAEVRP
jgi:hypothetical protein